LGANDRAGGRSNNDIRSANVDPGVQQAGEHADFPGNRGVSAGAENERAYCHSDSLIAARIFLPGCIVCKRVVRWRDSSRLLCARWWSNSGGMIPARSEVTVLCIRDLARQIGVSHAAPVHHFGDKAGLRRSLPPTAS
jgi:hypothetical protein